MATPEHRSAPVFVKEADLDNPATDGYVPVWDSSARRFTLAEGSSGAGLPEGGDDPGVLARIDATDAFVDDPILTKVRGVTPAAPAGGSLVESSVELYPTDVDDQDVSGGWVQMSGVRAVATTAGQSANAGTVQAKGGELGRAYEAADGSDEAFGGDVNIQGGDADATDGYYAFGGDVFIAGGRSDDGDYSYGGDATLQGGSAFGSNAVGAGSASVSGGTSDTQGGSASVRGGNALADGAQGGNVSIISGAGSTNGATAGSVSIAPGSVQDQTGADVTINGGRSQTGLSADQGKVRFTDPINGTSHVEIGGSRSIDASHFMQGATGLLVNLDGGTPVVAPTVDVASGTLAADLHAALVDRGIIRSAA